METAEAVEAAEVVETAEAELAAGAMAVKSAEAMETTEVELCSGGVASQGCWRGRQHGRSLQGRCRGRHTWAARSCSGKGRLA